MDSMYRCCILLFASLAGASGEGTETTVVIIGGGAAGIAAASYLHRNSIDFVLYEADGRLGGRVKETQIGNYTVELGAQWISGATQIENASKLNPVWADKLKLGIRGNFTDWKNELFLTRNGTKIEQAMIDKWVRRREDAMKFCLGKSEALWEKADELDIEAPENVIDVSMKACFEESGYRDGNLSDIDAVMADTMEWTEVDWEFTPRPERISTMWGFPVNGPWVDNDFMVTDERGYSVFLREMARPFMSSVKLQHKVTEVAYNNTSVKVTLADGSQISARAAISTLSIGVMQRQTINFSPAFSQAKMQGINGMRMGNYAKVALQWGENFWGNDHELIMLAGEPLGFMTAGVNRDHAKFMPGSNIIEYHFVDEIARRIETQPVSQTQAEVMTEMRNLFGDGIPDPLNIHVTDWTNNPLTYGSYSWWPLNYTEEQWEEMKRPEGRLYFAGEHTSDNYGYVHTALQTGLDAAEAVVKDLRSEVTTTTDKDVRSEGTNTTDGDAVVDSAPTLARLPPFLLAACAAVCALNAQP